MTLGSRFFAWMVAFATTVAAMHVPLPAVAQDYDEETIVQVNEHFKNGAQLYYDGDYDAAIREFEAAHALIPNAIFLYNISLAQAKKGESKKSLATAEAAQEFGGLGASEQVQNQARIAALRRVNASEEAAVGISNAPKVEPLLQFGLLSWVGTGVMVVGVLGLAGVAVIDRSIAADVDDYKAAAARGDLQTYEQLRDDIRPKQTGGRVLFVMSSLAIVSGAGLLVYDLVLRKDESTVALAPIRGGVGVSFTHRF